MRWSEESEGACGGGGKGRGEVSLCSILSLSVVLCLARAGVFSDTVSAYAFFRDGECWVLLLNLGW